MKYRSFISIALLVLLAGCSTPPQADMKLIRSHLGSFDVWKLEMTIIADDPVELERVVINNGECESIYRYKSSRAKSMNATFKKGDVIYIFDDKCTTFNRGIYKATLVASNGTTWDFNF